VLNDQPASQLIEHFRSIGLIKDSDFPSSIEKWREDFREVSPVVCIGRISPRPILILHGDGDNVVPLEHAYRLYREAAEPKELIIIPGANHRLRLEEKAVAAALNWLKARISA
jgi:fermentation-respiration switch protein FrsA (DUF1100 family)